MGSCCSTPDRVEPVSSRGTELDTVDADKNEGGFKLPVRKRHCTDVLFFILLLLFLIVLVVLTTYCAVNGDIYRIVNGYDNCGNICGRKNAAFPRYDTLGYCKGEDMTSKKYLQISEAGKLVVNSKNVVRSCVTECSNDYVRFLNRCIPKASEENVNTFFSKTGFKNFFQEVAEDLEMTWREILCLCLIAFGMSIVLLLLLRFLAGMVVLLVLIGISLASIAGTIFLWILWKKKKDEMSKEKITNKEMGNVTATSYLAFAIVATVVTVIVLLVILVMRKRIKLVVQLFKEAGRAIHNMPLLLLEPILTFIALGCVVATWFLFSILIESSGFFTAKEEEPVSFEKDMTMKVTRWYNLLGLFWFTQFCIACQHMIIAGAIAAWYFTRNKNDMESPICWSFYNLVRYHLGTVALGSLLIALVQLVRAILAAIQYQVKGHENAASRCLFRTCQCCLYCFEKILKFLSRNAYIETAMYGYSFCKAGQQAFKQLTSNALRVAAINSVGDFVLFLGKALVVVATVLIGIEILRGKEGIQHIWIPLALAGIFAYLISHCFITVYEMAIDTIFLCFCEDCEQNDGLSRPYYMSRGLMEFVQNSKKALSVEDARSAWSSESTRSVPSVSAKTNVA